MGILSGISQPFTQKHLKDRNLIISMLKAEEILWKSDIGQDLHRTEAEINVNFPQCERKKLKLDMAQYEIQRRILLDFGFSPDKESTDNYREIFRTYYRSPTDYDKEVLDSVHYMRHNRCVYYTAPIINVGDNIKDVLKDPEQPPINVQNLAGENKALLDIINNIPEQKIILAAFSMS